MECRDEFRYNVDAVDCLIRAHLVQMQQYDQHLAASMENGLNYMAVAFSMQLVQRFCVEDKQATQGMKASLTKQVNESLIIFTGLLFLRQYAVVHCCATHIVVDKYKYEFRSLFLSLKCIRKLHFTNNLNKQMTIES